MITIRPRVPDDDDALARLFEEMQEYYEVPCPPRETILDGLSSLPVGVTILVAEMDRIVGFVAFSPIYPGALASGLFIKELFVAGACRKTGIGTQLMRAVAEYAVQHGYKRLDWTADRNNARLLGFYDGFGARRLEDKVFFRLTGEALAKLAHPPKP
jgi:GNAT superfamily N-acetyltransferase